MRLKAINCYPQNGECYLSFDHAADRAESEVKLQNTHKQQICTTTPTTFFPPRLLSKITFDTKVGIKHFV